jgi:histidine ammonia-lyase
VFARAVGISRGGSGARSEVLQGLVDLLNAGVHPLVAEVGSVGAADLGHLGQIAWVLTGHGEARLNGELLPAREALARAGLEPLELQPKDGIALLVANSVSIGLGALAVLEAERAARLADLAGALTLETLHGNLSILEPEVQAAKPFQGQADAAGNLRALLAGSRLWNPGTAVSLQDPLSIRTLPQVHGAFREQLAAARQAVSVELNGRGDNPLLVPETGRALSNGNFHALALALAFDALRVGIAHVGMVSERRAQKLVALRWGHDVSVDDEVRNGRWRAERYAAPGLLAYSAAALSGELKQLAAPVTLGAPPLDLDVEDHATFAPQAVMLARQAVQRLTLLLASEAFLAADALGVHAELPRLGEGTGRAYAELSALVDTLDPETPAATAVARAQELLLALVS